MYQMWLKKAVKSPMVSVARQHPLAAHPKEQQNADVPHQLHGREVAGPDAVAAMCRSM